MDREGTKKASRTKVRKNVSSPGREKVDGQGDLIPNSNSLDVPKSFLDVGKSVASVSGSIQAWAELGVVLWLARKGKKPESWA